MRIGIIGVGHIGGTLAKHFVDAEHEVAISNSRGPDTLAGLVAKLGEGAQAMTPADAARFGDVVVVSIPSAATARCRSTAFRQGGDRHEQLLPAAGRHVRGAGRRPHNLERAPAGAPLYCPRRQGVNAIVWTRLRDDGRPGGDEGRLGIPISGDDEQAKRTVAELIDEIGFDPVDAGTLAEGGRKHQPGTPAYPQGVPTAELRALLAS